MKKLELEKYDSFIEIIQKLSITEFYLNIIKKYTIDFIKIVKNAPPLQQKLIVYRGVQSDYYTDYINKSNHICYIPACMSTSLDPNYALRFFNLQKKCCIKIITLLPGTKCLLLDSMGYMDKLQEIVLPYGTKMYNLNDLNNELYYDYNGNMECPKMEFKINIINLICLGDF